MGRGRGDFETVDTTTSALLLLLKLSCINEGYCIVLYGIVLHCIVFYCIAHCIVLYCIVLYCRSGGGGGKVFLTSRPNNR